MQPAPYRTRTSVLFALRARKAVVLRRGPRTLWRLVVWDLDGDSFEPGQWMRGLVHLCDLSPTGGKLIYWAAQYHPHAPWKGDRNAPRPFDPARATAVGDPRPKHRRHRRIPRYQLPPGSDRAHLPRRNTGTWTAISTPPYFSALAIWPAFGRWTGGGAFLSENQIMIRESDDAMTPVVNVPIPSTIRFLPGLASRTATSAYSPLLERGEPHTLVRQALLGAGLGFVDWVSVHDGDDLLFAGDGRIWRLEDWARVPPPEFLARARELIDLRDWKFGLVEPPRAALRW